MTHQRSRAEALRDRAIYDGLHIWTIGRER